MGFKLVRFQNKKGEVSFGKLEGESIFPFPGTALNLGVFLESKIWLKATGSEKISAKEIEFLSPVTAPCQIICQGKNYLDHLLETGVKPANKDFNILFTKADSSLAPPVGDLARPEGVRLLDYELELGLVIKKPILGPTKITRENLPDYVAGLVMANDFSARDVQVPQRQWFKGKSYRGFCPVGPVLYLLEEHEFAALGNLELHLSVNGETRQKASTGQMMYGPVDTLTEISQIFDLRPGDLLLTGTPGGVAMKVKPKSALEEAVDSFRSEKEKFADFVSEQAISPRYLREGDVIESSIRSADGMINLGQQRIRVRG